MQISLKQRHENMESKLSSMIGVPVELTIRSESEFTFSCEGEKMLEMEALVIAIGGTLDSVEYDEELHETFCFLNAK